MQPKPLLGIAGGEARRRALSCAESLAHMRTTASSGRTQVMPGCCGLGVAQARVDGRARAVASTGLGMGEIKTLRSGFHGRARRGSEPRSQRNGFGQSTQSQQQRVISDTEALECAHHHCERLCARARLYRTKQLRRCAVRMGRARPRAASNTQTAGLCPQSAWMGAKRTLRRLTMLVDHSAPHGPAAHGGAESGRCGLRRSLCQAHKPTNGS